MVLAVQVADDREPPLVGERASAVGEGAAADEVEREIDALAPGCLQHLAGKAAAGRHDADVKPHALQLLELCRRARDADHFSPQILAGLHGYDTHAGGRAPDEQRFPGLELPVLENRLI